MTREGPAIGRGLLLVAVLALVAALAGSSSIFLIGAAPPLAVGLRMLGALVAPALLAVVLTALLSRAGALDRRHATVLLVSGEVAVLAGALAQLSWEVGFDAADEGRPPSPLADAFGPLLLGALTAGAVAAVALFDGVLHELRSRVLRIAIALVLAVVGVPAVGLALVQPTTAGAGAAALLVLVLRRRRRRQQVPLGAS